MAGVPSDDSDDESMALSSLEKRYQSLEAITQDTKALDEIFEILASVPWLDEGKVEERELKGVAMHSLVGTLEEVGFGVREQLQAIWRGQRDAEVRACAVSVRGGGCGRCFFGREVGGVRGEGGQLSTPQVDTTPHHAVPRPTSTSAPASPCPATANCHAPANRYPLTGTPPPSLPSAATKQALLPSDASPKAAAAVMAVLFHTKQLEDTYGPPPEGGGFTA